MSTIQTWLEKIAGERWARNVRTAIVNAITQCYTDVNSASLREDAFAAALQAAIDHGDIPGMVIADNSVPGTKIQDGTLPLSKLAEPVQITVDSALSGSSTNPVQNKVIKGAIDELNGSLGQLSVPPSVRFAIYSLLDSAVFTDEKSKASEFSEISDWATDVSVKSISAVYTQSKQVYTTTMLEELKEDLVVTATFDDNTSGRIPMRFCTLTGALSSGTSTITVAFGGKTDTFNVSVVRDVTAIYDWDFTESLTDKVESLDVVTSATRDSSGLTLSAANKYIILPRAFAFNRTYEIDVVSIEKRTDAHGRLFAVKTDTNTNTGADAYVLSGTKKGGDRFYVNNTWDTNAVVSSSNDLDGSYYNNSTVGFYVDSNGYISVYKNGVLLGTSEAAIVSHTEGEHVIIGGSSEDFLYTAVFSGCRVYNGLIY